jgi:predicted kinase
MDIHHKGTLIFFCGKMGAGKSTKALALAKAPDTILLSEDDWLSVLYPEEIHDFDDYLKYSSRMRPLIEKHVRSLLKSGLSVIMDFPGNTLKQRKWFKDIISKDNLPHRLIYLQASDQSCLERISKRITDSPERASFDTEEVFHQVTRHFQAPSKEEGFNIEYITVD